MIFPPEEYERVRILRPPALRRPLLPPGVMNAIQSVGGSDPVFLTEKRLEPSDVNMKLNWLFVPKAQALLAFMSRGERETVENGMNGGILRVTKIRPWGQHYVTKFKKWPSLKQLVIIKQWTKLVKENWLMEDELFQLWGFRVNYSLYFAVNVERGVTRMAQE
ncbi:unnamed protein product [Ilex paraguariensis]|uniref:DUF4283 domain-containing protein n=1 Tax=Ilex paraguariensis TaxID=185542 RepID=A0ABC8R6V4_9AQUA